MYRLFEMGISDLSAITAAAIPAGVESRPAQSEDYYRIWVLFRECFQHEKWSSPSRWTDERYQEWRESPGFTPSLWEVAWNDREPVGIVEASINEEECASLGKRVAHAWKVCVKEGWRGKGIALALLTRSLVRMREMGADEVTLDTEADNRSEAWRVYERAGYEVRRTF